MNGFLLRVTAYYGQPISLDGIPIRRSVAHDEPLPVGFRDSSSIDLEKVIDHFEGEYECKVNYGDSTVTFDDGIPIRFFDVFEPSWLLRRDAEDVVNDLTARLLQLVK